MKVNNCQSSPCLNGAVCNNDVNKYTCSCMAGYTGNNCGNGTYQLCIILLAISYFTV